MTFFTFLINWYKQTSFCFIALGAFLFFAGVLHTFINPYVASSLLAVFFGYGSIMFIQLFFKYLKEKEEDA